jgi:hypothetical protein
LFGEGRNGTTPLHCIAGRKEEPRESSALVTRATQTVHTTTPLCFLFDIFEDDGEDSYERLGTHMLDGLK